MPNRNHEPPRWWYAALVIVIIAVLALTPAITFMGVNF